MRVGIMISAERYCASCGAANTGDAELCHACGRSLKTTLPLPETLPALLVGRYRILAQVGTGGFSVVYRAVDTRAKNSRVAIKAISLSGLTPVEIIEATETFNREVALLAQLKHPSLPRVYHHFSDAETWYMVMDFIEGVTLEDYLGQQPGGFLPVSEALDIAHALCVVLEFLHAQQPPVIFRDLKPGNIIIRPDGHLSLIDFGIARRYRAGQLTDTIPFGSPGYASPEQYGRAQTTPRSDVYSLGAILHQMLTGIDPAQSPFRFVPLALAGQQATQPELDALIVSMVHMDASRRPESVSDIKRHIEGIAHAWLRQRHHLRAQAVPRGQRPGKIVRQSLDPSYGSGGAHFGGRQGQAQILVRQSLPGAGQSSHWWSKQQPYRSIPASPKQGRVMAIISLILSVIGILILPVGCAVLYRIAGDAAYASSQLDFFWQALSSFLILSVPSLLAVALGLRARANTSQRETQEIAASGIAIGIIVMLFYLALLALIILY